MSTVRLKATELEVFVDGVKVGWVTDCGDCWRAVVTASRKRKYLPDYDSRKDAVRGVVSAAGH
jgi:hypothetical protein